MTEQEQELFATIVLTILRQNGGELTLAANILAAGQFRVGWERLPNGDLRVRELPLEEEKLYQPAGGKYKPRPKRVVKAGQKKPGRKKLKPAVRRFTI